MNLLEQYRAQLAAKHYSEDPEQVKIIQALMELEERLARLPKAGGFMAKLFGAKPAPYLGGLYCWGGVGRGKTFIMDLFFDHLPGRKRRRHYHRFMLELHQSLRALGNVADPMDLVVKQLKEDIDVLLLDEFMVSDITDAMLLYKLLEALEKYNIALVTTSNIIPDNLYKNGLQRERFLPAIAWIKEKLTVLPVADGEDYRRRHFRGEDVFRTPNDAANNAALQADLAEISGKALDDRRPFLLDGRQIPIVARNQQTIVFDFAALCQGNYSQKDYIEIGKRFNYVGLINVPLLDADQEDAAKRFLLLIDEFYDQNIKLLLTSALPLAQIYQGKKLAFEYERLQSRLFEMQGSDYWNRQSNH